MILLLLYIVEQGPAVLAAGAGQVFYIFFYLSSLSNVLSFGRWLNMIEILWFQLLNLNGSCHLLPRTSSLSTGYRLEGLSLPRNSATINWLARHDLIVDWAIKLPTQTKFLHGLCHQNKLYLRQITKVHLFNNVWFDIRNLLFCLGCLHLSPLIFSFKKFWKENKDFISSSLSCSKWATAWENLFLPYANNKGADQSAHSRSLLSVFVIRYLDSIIPIHTC